jgi:hypothetical protein
MPSRCASRASAACRSTAPSSWPSLQKLDGGVRLDGVLADEDAILEAVQVVQRAEQERREAEAATRRAAAQAQARKREDARLVGAYGVSLSDDDE